MALPNAWPVVGDTGWAAALQGNVQYASDTAETAVAASTVVPAVVGADSFAGANDAAKLSAAMSFAASQTYVPWIQLPARNFDVGSSTFSLFSGFKLLSSGHAVGPKNLELAGGKYASGKFTFSGGNGSSSLFQATSTLYDISISGVAFQGGGSSAQAFRSTANMYACEFNALTFYGFKHVMGSPAEKFLMTQGRFTGHWQVLTQWDTQFHIGGSDNDLWKSGYVNLGGGGAVAGAGKYMIDLDGVGKTNVGWVYATCNNGWRGLVVNGAGSNGIQLDGGAYEGMNSGAPCDGNVIRVNGGIVSIRDIWCAYAMNAPGGTEHGVIEVTGGEVSISGVKYGRGVLAETVPLVYVSGSSTLVDVVHPMPDKGNATWTGRPRVTNATGTPGNVVTDTFCG